MRLALMKSITLTEYPELYRLLKEGKSLADFLKLSPQEILLPWCSCELKNAGSSRMATKFTKDLSGSEILTTVLKHIEPECCMLAIGSGPIRFEDDNELNWIKLVFWLSRNGG
jgi:hypothetical protein